MKTYDIKFVPSALKEWNKLGSTIKEQFKKKLSERIKNSHTPKDTLNSAKNLYKIKLRASGYRLVYEVDDGEIIILILSVGKRDGLDAYKEAFDRYKK